MISIIVPVYNEAPTLEALLALVDEVELDKEILLIDDGSTDGSTEIIRAREGKPGYRVFFNEVNRGKGFCVRLGIGEARGEIILFQDADLEYTPAELPGLIAPIQEGKADVVYGARFLDPHGAVKNFWHTHGNRLLTIMSNLATGLNLNDMETCYKIFRADVIKSIDIVCDDFGTEPEITAKIARIPGVRIWQLPISYAPRPRSRGKKITWKDGVLALWYIARFRLKR
jgi:glycosyltransferase involved in cell wall biosynthesis